MSVTGSGSGRCVCDRKWRRKVSVCDRKWVRQEVGVAYVVCLYRPFRSIVGNHLDSIHGVHEDLWGGQCVMCEDVWSVLTWQQWCHSSVSDDGATVQTEACDAREITVGMERGVVNTQHNTLTERLINCVRNIKIASFVWHAIVECSTEHKQLFLVH